MRNKPRFTPRNNQYFNMEDGTTLLIMHEGCTLIDTDDVNRVKALEWYIHASGYVHSRIARNQIISLARFIISFPVGMIADHKNREKLDNTKGNLRPVTYRQSNINRILPKKKSKHIGVKAKWSKFEASIRSSDGTRKYLGTYSTATEAAKAFDEAAKKYHGEFAVLNFPEDQK